MAQAIWKNIVLAESDDYEIVEGNVYFPPESINLEHFKQSHTHTVCPWKGTASYYDVVANESVNASAAWYYPEPTKAAAHIKDYVAFWKGVKVER